MPLFFVSSNSAAAVVGRLRTPCTVSDSVGPAIMTTGRTSPSSSVPPHDGADGDGGAGDITATTATTTTTSSSSCTGPSDAVENRRDDGRPFRKNSDPVRNHVLSVGPLVCLSPLRVEAMAEGGGDGLRAAHGRLLRPPPRPGRLCPTPRRACSGRRPGSPPPPGDGPLSPPAPGYRVRCPDPPVGPDAPRRACGRTTPRWSASRGGGEKGGRSLSPPPPDRQYVFGVHPHGIHCIPLTHFTTRGIGL